MLTFNSNNNKNVHKKSVCLCPNVLFCVCFSLFQFFGTAVVLKLFPSQIDFSCSGIGCSTCHKKNNKKKQDNRISVYYAVITTTGRFYLYLRNLQQNLARKC